MQHKYSSLLEGARHFALMRLHWGSMWESVFGPVAIHWAQEAGLSTLSNGLYIVLLSLPTQCVPSSLKGFNKNKSNVAACVSQCQYWQWELGLSQWMLWQVLHDRQAYGCVILYILHQFFTDEARRFSKMLNNLKLLFTCFDR